MKSNEVIQTSMLIKWRLNGFKKFHMKWDDGKVSITPWESDFYHSWSDDICIKLDQNCEEIIVLLGTVSPVLVISLLNQLQNVKNRDKMILKKRWPFS